MFTLAKSLGEWFHRIRCLVFGHKQTLKAKVKRRVSRGKDVEQAGQWYFKRDILDQLDDYFLFIRRMKRADPEGYKLYSRIGATLTPGKTLFHTELSPIWKKKSTMPGFGALALMLVDDRERQGDDNFYGMKFGYFRKLDKVPTEVEPTLHQVYEITMFNSRKADTSKGGRMSHNFYVSVAPGPVVTPLRCARVHDQRINHKDATAKNGTRYSVIRTKGWGYGGFLEDTTHCADSPEKKARIVFSMIATGYEYASMALRVAVTRGKVTAVFGVDLLRTPYFFDDREAAYTEGGSKKRIFHIVRTHPRELSPGRMVSVKSHFRGQRDFLWNGYHVLVSMPETHHRNLLDLTVAGESYDEDETLPSGGLSNAGLGKLISEHVTQ